MKMKRLLLIALLSLLFIMPIAPTTYAANTLPDCDTLRGGNGEPLTAAQKAALAESAACSVDKNKNPISGSDGVINKIAKGVALVAGSVAVIVIIVSGITMATSSGDSQSFKNARNGVIYAAVGLAIIVMAQALVTLVINGV